MEARTHTPLKAALLAAALGPQVEVRGALHVAGETQMGAAVPPNAWWFLVLGPRSPLGRSGGRAAGVQAQSSLREVGWGGAGNPTHFLCSAEVSKVTSP